MAAGVTFRAVLEQGGKTATGIRVPADAVATLGTSKRPAVHATVNGHTYRSTVAMTGGAFMLPVSAENRGLAGVAAGDEVDVTLAVDTEPRVMTVPGDFAAALAADADAKRLFDSLSYSKQGWFVLGIEGAKSAETRQRRIDKAVTMLREGRTP